MKLKNALWFSFIIAAIAVTGYNVHRIWGIHDGGSHQHDESNGHDGHGHNYEDFEIIPVDFNGIRADVTKAEIQSTYFAANNSSFIFSDNIICKNTENGEIYWYSETDNSVYQSSSGKVKIIFKKKAEGLVYYDNALYFISPEEDYWGHIWKYDFSTGALSEFSNISATAICIINNQFYCMVYSGDNILPYKLSANGGYEETEYIYCGSYRNYYLAYRFKDISGFPLLCLIDSETDEVIPLMTNNVNIMEQSVYKDTLYYRYFISIDETDQNNENICSVNLLTGERTKYDIANLLGTVHNFSYNFVNDKLLLMSETAMAEIDLVTDEVIKKDIQRVECDEAEHNHQALNTLYSDGETVYIVDREGNRLNTWDYVLWQ